MDELRPLLERARDAIPAPPDALKNLSERRRVGRRNHRLGAAAVALAVAGAGVVLGARAFRSPQGTPSDTPGASETGPVKLAITATVEVGEHPLGLAVGDGAIWAVTQPSDGGSEMVRVDSGTNRVVARGPYEGDPIQITAGAGAVWGIRAQDDSADLLRIDPSSLEVTGRAAFAGHLGPLVAGPEGVWVVVRPGRGSPSLVRVDPVTVEPVAEVPLGGMAGNVIGLELADGSVWVRGWEDPERAQGCARVLRVDPASRTVVQDLTIEGPVQAGPGGLRIASGTSAVWVNCRQGSNRLFVVRIGIGGAGGPIGLPKGVFWSIGAGAEGMWAAGFGAGEEPVLLLVDSSNGDVRGSIGLPGGATESAVYDSASGTVWIPDSRGAADSLMRIDTVPADTPANGSESEAPLRSSGSCPAVNAAYRPSAAPSFGEPGSTVTVSGPLPQRGKDGLPGDPITRVTAWWNLDPERWWTAVERPPAPRPADPGIVRLLEEADVSGECDFELRFTVPDVEPGTYQVVVIYESSAPSGPGHAAFEPMSIEVT